MTALDARELAHVGEHVGELDRLRLGRHRWHRSNHGALRRLALQPWCVDQLTNELEHMRAEPLVDNARRRVAVLQHVVQCGCAEHVGIVDAAQGGEVAHQRMGDVGISQRPLANLPMVGAGGEIDRLEPRTRSFETSLSNAIGTPDRPAQGADGEGGAGPAGSDATSRHYDIGNYQTAKWRTVGGHSDEDQNHVATVTLWRPTMQVSRKR